MYYEKFLPLITRYGTVTRNVAEYVNVSDVYCPLTTDKPIIESLDKDAVFVEFFGKRIIKVLQIEPLGLKVFNENDSFSYYVKNKYDGQAMLMDVTYIDYYDIVKQMTVTGTTVQIKKNQGLIIEPILTNYFINLAQGRLPVDFQDMATMGDTITIPIRDSISLFDIFEGETSVSESVNEATQDELNAIRQKFNATKQISRETDTIDYVYNWLDAYFQLPEGVDAKDGNGREVVPLMLGSTGVFKSATVKVLCKKYGYRMVDFRVAFTSRLDYSGLYKHQTVEGVDYAYACPMEELVTVSDAFREYCKKAIANLKAILSRGTMVVSRTTKGTKTDPNNPTASTDTEKVEEFEPLTDKNIKDINTMIEDYSKFVKTPVLFFDEITRTQNEGVEGVLVELLNQKRFNGMTMNGCKFVAATNLNMSDEKLNAIFQVSTNFDSAYLNRFMPLKVLSASVRGRWDRWGKQPNEDFPERINIHPVIQAYLTKNSGEAYNIKYLADIYDKSSLSDDGDPIKDASSAPFPNYRTWEMTTGYLYSIDKKKIFNTRVLLGLLGEAGGNKFIPFLVSQGYVVEVESPDTDDVGKFMEDNLRAGLPALLMGPTSLGKTSRVKAYMKKIKAETGIEPELITINLASMSVDEAMGMPRKEALTQYATSVTSVPYDDPNFQKYKFLNDDLKDALVESGKMGTVLGDTLTRRSPDLPTAMKFKKALAEPGKEIIVFFDECNRVVNPALMSIIFEVTSDHRLFGINFEADKYRVKVIAACNMGSKYKSAKALDSALSARFCVYWKKSYDMKDVKSFMTFLEDNADKENVDKTFLEYLKTLDETQLLAFLQSVEERTLANNEPSSRMLFQLGRDIQNMRGSKSANGELQGSLFNGSLLFNTMAQNELSTYFEIVADDNADINKAVAQARSIIKYVRDKGTRWEALYKSELFTRLEGIETNGQQLKDLLMSMDAELIQGMTAGDTAKVRNDLEWIQVVLLSMRDLDEAISANRKETFEAYGGSAFATGFIDFFNDRFGTGQDVDITIAMLNDIALIPDFYNRRMAEIGQSNIDDLIKAMLDYILEFWKTWGDTISADHHGAFLEGAMACINVSDAKRKFLQSLGVAHDPFMTYAETLGNDFIKKVLDPLHNKISDSNIASIQASVRAGTKTTLPKPKLL